MSVNVEKRDVLTNAAITSAVELAEEALADAGAGRRTSLRVTLLVEELLLRFQERFGEETAFTLSIVRRLGTMRLTAEVAGAPFNALEVATSDDGFGDAYDFVRVFVADELDPPTYDYRRQANVVTISLRVQKSRPVWANPMLVATFLAIASFVCLRAAMPGAVVGINEVVVTPLVSALMGALSAIAGPLLCVSLISGICALGDVATLKGMGIHAIGRIMVWVVLMFSVSVGVSMVCYHGATAQAAAAFDPGELFELLLSCVPQNLFLPFVEGNSLQIAVESAFVGVCILALGDRASLIKKLVVELNALVFKMMYIFSGLLPLLVGLSIFKMLASTDVSGLATLGMLVAANLLVVSIITAGALLWVRASLGVAPLEFVRKAWPALYICLTTGSTTSAMGDFFRISSDELGIDRKVVDFWVPLGHAMFAPSVIVPMVVGMFAVSGMEGVAFGASRLAILFLLVFQLSIATPKVPGGIAATFTILLGQLGLPLDSVGVMMAANVFVCNPEIAFGDLVRFVEICSFAKSEHALDEEQLAS